MDVAREIRPALDWTPVAPREGFDGWSDVRLETAEGIAKITIARPEVRNAFRPLTTAELITAFDMARDDPSVGVVVLTGEGPLAFSSARVLLRRGSGRPG
jgi:naphthoate synthase